MDPSNSLQSVRSFSTLYASPGFQGENGLLQTFWSVLDLGGGGGETRRTWRRQWEGGVRGLRSMRSSEVQWEGGVLGLRSMCWWLVGGERTERDRETERGLVSFSPLLSPLLSLRHTDTDTPVSPVLSRI